jgi:hypothetical protein
VRSNSGSLSASQLQRVQSAMGDMADAQRVVSLSCRRLAARHELVPFECYEPFLAALSPMTFTSRQLSRDECLAQAEECRATINAGEHGGAVGAARRGAAAHAWLTALDSCPHRRAQNTENPGDTGSTSPLRDGLQADAAEDSSHVLKPDHDCANDGQGHNGEPDSIRLLTSRVCRGGRRGRQSCSS